MINLNELATGRVIAETVYGPPSGWLRPTDRYARRKAEPEQEPESRVVYHKISDIIERVKGRVMVETKIAGIAFTFWVRGDDEDVALMPPDFQISVAARHGD